MIRITELALPLDYPPSALGKAIVKRLGIDAADLLDFTVFKRSYDARKKHAILFVYIIDLTARNEAAILKRFSSDRNIRVAPDTSYHPVGRAPQDLAERPIVVGF